MTRFFKPKTIAGARTTDEDPLEPVPAYRKMVDVLITWLQANLELDNENKIYVVSHNGRRLTRSITLTLELPMSWYRVWEASAVVEGLPLSTSLYLNVPLRKPDTPGWPLTYTLVTFKIKSHVDQRTVSVIDLYGGFSYLSITTTALLLVSRSMKGEICE